MFVCYFEVDELTSRRVDKMFVKKDNRLAKRKRVNKLGTHSLVSLLVNLSTKICSSVTLSFIYFVYKQLIYSLTRQLNMFLCYFVFYLLCLQATR